MDEQQQQSQQLASDTTQQQAGGESRQYGEPITVLDQGFVRLVDFMGGDLAVVQGARVSFGQETKGDDRDRKLINYLLKHEHGTPFEMSVFKFHVKAPIFVARQWFRHRVGCLSGETLLHFDLPSGMKRGKSKLHKTSIAKIHQLFHEGSAHRTSKRKPLYLERVEKDKTYTISELSKLVERRAEDLRNLVRREVLRATRDETATGNKARIFVCGSDWHAYAQQNYEARVSMNTRVRRMNLRMCNEDTGAIEHTQIADIWQSGTKPVYRVTLENGYQIKMTDEHRCLTARGWMTLGQATDLKCTTRGTVTWNADAPAFAVNGVAQHRDSSWLAARRGEGLSVAQIADSSGVSYHTVRKYLAKFGLQYTAHERGQLGGAAQRGRRRNTSPRRVLSQEHLSKIRAARSGEQSNFWKGGISSERARIARWTREQAARVHARNDFMCVACHGNEHLHAHHIDPVWHNADRAYDVNNLTTLCAECHRTLHRLNLELEFLQIYERDERLHDFWNVRSAPQPRPTNKRKVITTGLMRAFSPIEKIEYAGEEMTYDLEVTGRFHNFVANGFIVHNSYNEISYRYVEVKDEFYVPSELRAQDAKNKQASFAGTFNEDETRAGQELIAEAYREAYAGYLKLLEMGVAREMARIVLPVGMYTQFYVAYNARSLMNFVRLRTGEGAQSEIRDYAAAMNQIFKQMMPWTYEAFERFVLKTDERTNA